MKDIESIEKMRSRIWYASLFVYCGSMFSPTYCTNVGCPKMVLLDGLWTTVFGWLGAFFIGGIYLVWIANPLFIIGLIVNKKSPTWSLILSLAALAISLIFLGGGKILLNEAGHYGYITKLHIGYWLWVLSMSLLVSASIISIIKNKQKKPKE